MSQDGDRTEDDRAFEALLEYIHRSRGFDFTGYKRPSLTRRIRQRMAAVGIDDFGRYVDYMEVHPQEFGVLFDTILINVTAFFRDASAWDALRAEVVPRIVEAKPPSDPIRVWCAGSASGEEAYSLAIVLAEALGLDGFRERVKIYATDVDESALARARHALYDPKELEGVPPELQARYFEPVNHRRGFHRELRRSVIFGRHDLIQDAPISRIDLLSCRNTLMYFNSETQSRIIDRFCFALNPGGLLFLGKSETLLTYSDAFVPVDLRRRIFARITRGGARDRPPLTARAGNHGEAADDLAGNGRIGAAAFEAGITAQLTVDFSGLLVQANERARALFGLTAGDLGCPFQDLQISYRPADLRTCIDRVYADRRPIVLDEVEWPTAAGGPRFLEIHVVPLLDPAGAPMGVSAAFLDVTANRRLRAELECANRELATAYEELQSTNEELETTNEELQSTNEELETTNEELQSTNEELETTNEELQSTNEEVETVNDELRERGEALKRLNGFFNAILASLRDGVAVIDRDLLVHVWNDRAEDLWGLRTDEVQGKHLLNLDFGLPLDELKQPIRTCLGGGPTSQELTLDATNRRGRKIRCRTTVTPMMADGEIAGVILVMEEERDGARAPSAATTSEAG